MNPIFICCAHVSCLLHSATHTGDFEFYKVNGEYHDTEAIQDWLTRTLHEPMPCTVDSAAIAGMIDLLKCQGCFALSARYALCFSRSLSFNFGKDINPMDTDTTYPTIEHYDEIGKIFDKALDEYVSTNNVNTLEEISSSSEKRSNLASAMIHSLSLLIDSSTRLAFSKFISFDIEEGGLGQFIQATVDAFFDNDLLQTVRTFLENSKGSFGLCVATSIEAHRQVCIAAKGQTNSVAFYPRKGVICYGSEQAAVKVSVHVSMIIY